jgi:glycosyltransferase involved in cell wall biosynthesis
LEGRILLTVGRDAPQKNYAPFYEAIPSLFLETNFSLAHVGLDSTALRGSLPEDCRPRVFSWEHMLKERMPLLYRAADGFIMTSKYEGFSLAVLEALAEGLPLILTDVPGFRVYRTLGFDPIFWVPLEKPDFYPALIRALVEWENSGVSRFPSQVGRAREFFLQSRQHQKLEAIYQKVCRDSGRPR